MWCEYELSTATQQWRWRISLVEPAPVSSSASSSLPLAPSSSPAPSAPLPAWTQLGCKRCAGCPLSAPDSAPCPAAVAVVDVVEALDQVASIEAVDVVVRMPEREVRKRTTGAVAARSVLGLLLATSGCPVLEPLRPLARHHLPFASEEEWMFRLVGLQLLRGWFAAKDGGDGGDAHAGDVTLRDLPRLLRELRALNTAFAARLREACTLDAGPNAMVQLFSLGVGAECDVDDGLGSLRRFLQG